MRVMGNKMREVLKEIEKVMGRKEKERKDEWWDKECRDAKR